MPVFLGRLKKVPYKVVTVRFHNKLMPLFVCLSIVPQWSQRDMLAGANECSVSKAATVLTARKVILQTILDASIHSQAHEYSP